MMLVCTFCLSEFNECPIISENLPRNKTFGDQVYLVRKLLVRMHDSGFLAVVDYKVDLFLPLLEVCTDLACQIDD